uniref:Ashwin n=1 Tax=Setaria digitata TaxID=48799 RepID=A0A915Q0P5_9BILA
MILASKETNETQRMYWHYQKLKNMAKSESAIRPSTSTTLLFPELMSREELIDILKQKFQRAGINAGKIEKFTDDELLGQFKKFAMPKPQRKMCSTDHVVDSCRNNRNSNDSQKLSVDKIENSGTVRNRVNSNSRQRTTVFGKRHNSSSTEYHPAEKNTRKHSPIRFP